MAVTECTDLRDNPSKPNTVGGVRDCLYKMLREFKLKSLLVLYLQFSDISWVAHFTRDRHHTRAVTEVHLWTSGTHHPCSFTSHTTSCCASHGVLITLSIAPPSPLPAVTGRKLALFGISTHSHVPSLVMKTCMHCCLREVSHSVTFQ
jgi:hypothetical protein